MPRTGSRMPPLEKAETTDYVIFRENNVYKAKRGDDGVVQFNNLDPAVLIETIWSALNDLGGGSFRTIGAGETWTINSTIDSQGDNVTWKSDGSLTLFAVAALNNNMVSLTDDNLVIDGLHLYGNHANQADQGSPVLQNGILLTGVADSELRGLEIAENLRGGICIQTSTDNIFHHNHLHDNEGDGFIGLQASHRNTIQDNDVVDNGAAGIKFDGDDGDCNYNRVLDNISIGNADEQIWGLRGINEFLISRNHCSAGTTETQAGIYIDGCRRITIDHNFCWGNTGEGIAIEVGTSTVGCSGVIIDHNQCWDNDRAGILIAGSAAFGIFDVVINGNICIDNNTDNDPWAEIHVDYSDHITITGNRCRDVTAAWHPIHIDHSDRGIIASNNCDAAINIINSTNMISGFNIESA